MTNALAAVARTYADAICSAVQQEYPNSLRHTMSGPNDRPLPQQIHPAFYGCFDWHSAVEMHWALVKMLRLTPESFHTADVVGSGSGRTAGAGYWRWPPSCTTGPTTAGARPRTGRPPSPRWPTDWPG